MCTVNIQNCRAQDNLVTLGDNANAPRQEAVVHFLWEEVTKYQQTCSKVRNRGRAMLYDRAILYNTEYLWMEKCINGLHT